MSQHPWTQTASLQVVAVETPDFVLRAFGRHGTGHKALIESLVNCIGRLNLADTTWTADTYHWPWYLGGVNWPRGVFRFPVEDRIPNYRPSSPGYMTPLLLLGEPEFVCDTGLGSAPTPDFFSKR